MCLNYYFFLIILISPIFEDTLGLLNKMNLLTILEILKICKVIVCPNVSQKSQRLWSRVSNQPGIHGGVPGHREGQVQGEPPDWAYHTPQPTASQRRRTSYNTSQNIYFWIKFILKWEKLIFIVTYFSWHKNAINV